MAIGTDMAVKRLSEIYRCGLLSDSEIGECYDSHGEAWQASAVPEFPSQISHVGSDQYQVELTEHWSIAGVLNGGYLQQVAARAAVSRSEKPHPVAVTTDFLSRCRIGQAQLHVEPLRIGGAIDTMRVTMVQDDQPVLVSSVVVGELLDQAPDVDMSVHVDLPSAERCMRIEVDTLADAPLPLMERFDIRLAPECVPVLRGQGDGSFALRGWARLANGEDPDPYTCLVAVDAFPPVTFTLGWHQWVPTVQLSTYIRALPSPGWLRAELRGRVMAQGWLDEECTMRDASGKIVAQAHQLVRLRGTAKPPAPRKHAKNDKHSR